MKWFLFEGSNKGEHRKEPKPVVEDSEGKDGRFSTLDDSLMIFGGSVTYDSKHHQKLACRKVYMAESAAPSFLRWSKSMITINWTDHLESIL